MLKKIQLCLTLFFCVVFFASCSSKSTVLFQTGLSVEGVGGVDSMEMEALNKNGRQGTITNPKESAYIYLGLNELQLPLLTQLQNQWGGLSCWLTVESLGSENLPQGGLGQLAFGLLYQSDFTESGKLNKDLAERALARCVFPITTEKNATVDTFTLSMVIPFHKIQDLRGILLHSDTPVTITTTGLAPIQVGFKGKSAYYFSSSGGLWDRTKSLLGFDFSLAKEDFEATIASGKNPSQKNWFPVLGFSLEPSPVMPEKTSQQASVRFEIGGEAIRLRRSPKQTKASFPCAGLEQPFGNLTLTENQEMVRDIILNLVNLPVHKDGSVVEPLVTDPGMIPLWPQSAWRHPDYELFEWEEFPGLLFFDTADYGIQDDFFKRLAFYTEKTGYVGTLVSDADLVGQHGFNAHDYRSETLAAFFTLAESTNFPLNKKEEILKDILLHKGIIKKAATGYEPGYGAVISLSQESAMYLRYTFVAHEGFHGIFFVDEDFRNYVASVYDTADPQSVHFLRRYFQIQASLGYNLNDTYLMHNEFMAYVMQQPVNRTGAYFAENLAKRGSMLRAEPKLCAYIQESKGQGFSQASELLSRYVFSRWGIESGRVSLVSR